MASQEAAALRRGGLIGQTAAIGSKANTNARKRYNDPLRSCGFLKTIVCSIFGEADGAFRSPLPAHEAVACNFPACSAFEFSMPELARAGLDQMAGIRRKTLSLCAVRKPHAVWRYTQSMKREFWR